jgi:hypothetical protein
MAVLYLLIPWSLLSNWSTYQNVKKTYQELERLFDPLFKLHMEILLGDFNARVRREDIRVQSIKIKIF